MVRFEWLVAAAAAIYGVPVDAQVTSCGGDLSNGGSIAYTSPGNGDVCAWNIQCTSQNDVATISFSSFSTESNFGTFLRSTFCPRVASVSADPQRQKSTDDLSTS